MKRIVIDKIASVTRNCQLQRDVRVSREFPCQEGDVIAVRVLSRKSTYNQLELVTGRFCELKPGDVVGGALGHRRALCGYAGHIPESLEQGALVHLLNLGGVIGLCDSYNQNVGAPFECEVLGQVLHFPFLAERIGVPASIRHDALPLSEDLVCSTPVVVVVGTCMNSGKTRACNSLIQELVHRGLRVSAAKCTGVSLRRDIHEMEDSGASRTLIFTDFGVVTTSRHNSARLTRSMLTQLSKGSPDLIVLELGDGLLGDYGVDAILEDETIRRCFRAVVLAANDPVGAWGGLELLKNRYGLRPDVVTGPATDNAAGTDLLERGMNVAAINARVSAPELAERVLKNLQAPVAREASLHG